MRGRRTVVPGLLKEVEKKSPRMYVAQGSHDIGYETLVIRIELVSRRPSYPHLASFYLHVATSRIYC